jgi:hypothetical protein
MERAQAWRHRERSTAMRHVGSAWRGATGGAQREPGPEAMLGRAMDAEEKSDRLMEQFVGELAAESGWRVMELAERASAMGDWAGVKRLTEVAQERKPEKREQEAKARNNEGLD